MLFELPEYEEAAGRVFGGAVTALALEQHPILKEVRRKAVSEVRPTRLSGGGEPPLELAPIEVSEEIVFDVREIVDGNFDSVYVAADRLGAAKGSALVKGMVDHLTDIAERTGNQVDAGGRPFTPEVFFEALDKMDVNFDEAGNPTFSFLVSPEMGRKLSEMPPLTEEQQARYDEILARKRAEFESRRRRRRL